MKDWPDIESAYIPELSRLLDVTTRWTTPNDLNDDLPFIAVRPPVGSDDGIQWSGTVDFDCFAATYRDARDLARKVRATVLRTHNRVVNGIQIGSVETATGPQYVPYSESVERFIYTARITTRPQ